MINETTQQQEFTADIENIIKENGDLVIDLKAHYQDEYENENEELVQDVYFEITSGEVEEGEVFDIDGNENVYEVESRDGKMWLVTEIEA